MNLKNIYIDKIETIYLKDSEGNMVELFKGKNFNYNYSCDSYGNRKLKIDCDLSDKSDLLLRLQNNIFIRKMEHNCSAAGYDFETGV